MMRRHLPIFWCLAATNICLMLNGTSLSAQLIYLWGAKGSGRSHLLQALCHRYAESGASTLYLPLDSRSDFARKFWSIRVLCLLSV